MKRLSEFEEMVRECKPTHFLFLSQDQESYDPLEPCAIRFDFSEVFVDLASQSVFVKSGNGYMSIERIVGIDEEDSLIGKIITFHCGGKSWRTNDYSYRFLVA